MMTPEIRSLISQCEANIVSFNNDQMSAALHCIQTTENEIRSVILLMDGLAEQWGDEGIFRRCRDRLRALVME